MPERISVNLADRRLKNHQPLIGQGRQAVGEEEGKDRGHGITESLVQLLKPPHQKSPWPELCYPPKRGLLVWKMFWGSWEKEKSKHINVATIYSFLREHSTSTAPPWRMVGTEQHCLAQNWTYSSMRRGNHCAALCVVALGNTVHHSAQWTVPRHLFPILQSL